MLEGRRAFAWLIDFAPKAKATTHRAYSARKSLITASIAGIFVFAVLTVLRVPLALLLGLLAFILDFIPVVGTIIMAAVASLFGLLVSPGCALIVVAAILAYHGIEAYLLIPRITIGATLQGPIGAVLALPIAAAYPIVERIWLGKKLPPDTVDRHEDLEQTGRRAST